MKDTTKPDQTSKRIRQAFNSIDTRLQTDFARYCKSEHIVGSKEWGLIPPKAETVKVFDAMNQVLKKHDIDYKTMTSLWPPIEREMKEAGAEAMHNIRQEKIRPQIEADLSLVMAYQKPIMIANDMETSIKTGSYLNANELEHIVDQYESIDLHSGLIGNKPTEITMFAYPLHTEQPQANSSWSLNVPIHDIINLSSGGQAIITDRAVFITGQDRLHDKSMTNIYNEILKAQDIQLPNIQGKEGCLALLEYAKTPEISMIDQIRNAQVHYRDSNAVQEIVSNYLNQETAYNHTAAICTNDTGLFVINNNTYQPINYNDIQPGMLIKLDLNQAQPMECVNIDNSTIIPETMMVLDIEQIYDDKFLITDNGILANKDLSQEFGFNYSQTINQQDFDNR